MTAVAGPDPGRVHSRDDMVRELDLLRVRAADGSRKLRVSLADLAGRIGEPRSTVHSYVAGTHLPAANVLDRMVIALGATAAEQQGWGEAWFRVATEHGRNGHAGHRHASNGHAVIGHGSNGPVPHQLLPDIEGFRGRAAELADLDRCAAAATGPEPALVIAAVAGTGGVGKTALVARWGHRVAAAFPDGQLWVNLRGYDRDQPLSAASALAGFLRALGVPDRDIPADLAERAALYRSVLAERRVLVVLDNARDTEHARLLLPGTAGCLLVVTSRDSLTGLIARHGARRIEVDVLPELDARALLTRLLGDRSRRQPEATTALVQRCGRLPLALRIAAELALRRTGVPLAELADELADEHRLLDLLDAGGDQRTSVRGVLSWSYKHCPPALARAFRLLGLVPGADLDTDAAAALFDTPAEEAGRLLAALSSAHLVVEATAGRYSQHDLLRAWAAERSTAVDAPEQRAAALARWFEHHLHTAAAAMDRLYPHEGHRRPPMAAPARPVPTFGADAAARDWLAAERANLLALATTYRSGPRQVVALSGVLEHHFVYRGHHDDARTLHEHALAAAEEEGNDVGAVRIRTALGCTHRLAGRYRDAEHHLQLALTLARAAGDRHGQAHALRNLGITVSQQRRLDEARACHLAALAAFRTLGDRRAEAGSLTNLGAVCGHAEENTAGIDYHRQALVIARELGDRDIEANAVNNLGVIFEQLGEFDRAAGCYQAALALHRELGDQRSEARVLGNLGGVAREAGDFPRAIDHFVRALHMFRAQGGRRGEGLTLNAIGTAYHGLGRLDIAERYWRRALALYDEMGLAEAAEIRRALADLPAG